MDFKETQFLTFLGFFDLAAAIRYPLTIIRLCSDRNVLQ